jgi:hypothetical protein
MALVAAGEFVLYGILGKIKATRDIPRWPLNTLKTAVS